MRWISLFLLALSSGASALEAHIQADYDLYYRGAPAGTVTVTVSRETARIYYEAKATPGLLARVFGQGVIIERGTVDKEDLRPLEYFYHDTGREKSYKYVYDWAHGKVVVTTHTEQVTRALSEGIQDPVSMAMLLLRDLPNIAPNYSVLSQGKLQVYRYRPPEPDTLEVDGEARSVWKVERRRGDARDTRIYTWHDPQRDFWMVKTLRMEESSEKVRLELTDYTSGPLEN